MTIVYGKCDVAQAEAEAKSPWVLCRSRGGLIAALTGPGGEPVAPIPAGVVLDYSSEREVDVKTYLRLMLYEQHTATPVTERGRRCLHSMQSKDGTEEIARAQVLMGKPWPKMPHLPANALAGAAVWYRPRTIVDDLPLQISILGYVIVMSRRERRQ